VSGGRGRRGGGLCCGLGRKEEGAYLGEASPEEESRNSVKPEPKDAGQEEKNAF